MWNEHIPQQLDVLRRCVEKILALCMQLRQQEGLTHLPFPHAKLTANSCILSFKRLNRCQDTWPQLNQGSLSGALPSRQPGFIFSKPIKIAD